MPEGCRKARGKASARFPLSITRFPFFLIMVFDKRFVVRRCHLRSALAVRGNACFAVVLAQNTDPELASSAYSAQCSMRNYVMAHLNPNSHAVFERFLARQGAADTPFLNAQLHALQCLGHNIV